MSKKVIVSLVVVVIVVLGIGGYTMLSRKDSDGSTRSSSTSQNESSSQESATSKATVATVSDACTVFSAADLTSALGATFAEGSSKGYSVVTNSDGLPQVQCDWEENGGDDPSEYTVHLDVYNFANEDNAKTDMSNSRVTGGNLSHEDITGVADEAMFARSGSGPKFVQAAIYWRKGNTVYHMSAVKLAGIERSTVESSLKSLVSSKY